MKIEATKDLTVHFMVRNEYPTCYFSLLSVLPGVEKAVVVDTGSTDGTMELLQEVKRLFPDKVELSECDEAPDSTDWSFSKFNPRNHALTGIRNWMIQQTKTKFCWVVDGDEVYRDQGVQQVAEYIRNFPDLVQAAYVPLLWFARDLNHLCNDVYPGVYGYTGRLFRTKDLSVKGSFPGEMHTYDGRHDIHPDKPGTAKLTHMVPFHHYEMVTKPHRRRLFSVVPYDGPQPEVFDRYGNKNGNKQ